MTRSLLSPEGLRRLAEDVFSNPDVPVAPCDEPWPTTVTLARALQDEECVACEVVRCTDCPRAKPET